MDVGTTCFLVGENVRILTRYTVYLLLGTGDAGRGARQRRITIFNKKYNYVMVGERTQCCSRYLW